MVERSGSVAVFAALGDPTRQRIVEMLSLGERTVSSLADDLPITLQGTLKHLTLLEGAGLVTRTKSGRTVTCRLDPQGLERAEAWMQRTRSFWTAQLANLADHFTEDA